jgi:hypothetical protein
MNYAQYMRKIASNQRQLIGYQNGQDSSLQTHKVQARAQSVKTPSIVQTNFSKPGGTVGNILQTSQQTSSPTDQVCSSGYRSVTDGRDTTDATASVMGAKVHCAVCSTDSPVPYAVEIPCGIFIDPPSNAPGKTKCCLKDMGKLYTDPRELIEDQGRQSDLRKRYNLPSKLQGLRGPILTNR